MAGGSSGETTTSKLKEDVKQNDREKNACIQDVKQDDGKNAMPVLDEYGTTYDDVIRRIEEMDATEFKDSYEYETVNLSAATFQNSEKVSNDVDVRNLRMTLILIPHGLYIQLSALVCIVMTWNIICMVTTITRRE